MQTFSLSTPAKTNPQTARPKRRSVFWVKRILLGLVITLVVLPATGAAYQVIATQADHRNFPPPGQLYDVGSYRLHIYCTGPQDSGNPTVILDTLSGGSSVNWGWIQPEIAKSTRVCSYDRAGFGWSDPIATPPSFQQTVTDLHTLLAKAGLIGPYILVGHSKGGLIARGYAASYPAEVAGIVLIDASQPDLFMRHPERLAESAALVEQSRPFPLLARLGLFHLYFATGGEFDFQDLPAREHDELATFWSSPEYWSIQRADNMVGAGFFEQALELGGLGNLPLIVVSAGTNPYPEIQAELAALSSNSLHITVEGATHASLAFNPQDARATGAAILQVVQAVRLGQPVAMK
jgi:pimeloyl-ACP methyl ester carboxylesterase